MQFFEFNGIITEGNWEEENSDRKVRSERARKLAKKTKVYNSRLKNDSFFFVADALDGDIRIGAIVRTPKDINDLFRGLVDSLEIKVENGYVKETTIATICAMLAAASRSGFIPEHDEILERYDLARLSNKRYICYNEEMLAECTKKEANECAAKFMLEESLTPEIDRIFAGDPKIGFKGHPVHYMITTDDVRVFRGTTYTLLGALYSNGRLRSKRFSILSIRPDSEYSMKAYESLYRNSIGGAVVVRYWAEEGLESDYACNGRDTIDSLCEMMRKYRNDVLTIFSLPRESVKTKALFYENFGDTSVLEIKEDLADAARARKYLRYVAKQHEEKTDRSLFAELEEGRTYLAHDLNLMYDRWYNRKLKTKIYPQYKDLAAETKRAVNTKSKGSAYDELQEMIGLKEAKRVIDRAVNYYKAQKLFADRGMKSDLATMHMVFTGNPGTAKTTVARLFARIMRDNGLLAVGDCVEVGRGDLVGKYVGWTAPLIKKKFEQAMGSVLFIDEAYSLVDDRDGSYGDEAISTIVQEMENHREDTVVIFAGYPDKMEEFLKKNPGLRSRIAFHVPFEDYSSEELCDIAKYVAKGKGVRLTDEAVEKLGELFGSVRTEADFGNGRYVRNVIEQARMAQATRLLSMDSDSVSRKDVETIVAEDIEIPEAHREEQKRKIGFCA